MEITKELILKDYKYLKTIAISHLYQKRYERALQFINLAANLMYNANLIYADNELENFLKIISKAVIKEKKFNAKNNKILFYDYFAWDNRGLTEQFIDAFLLNSDFDVFFVCEHKFNEHSSEVVKKLKINRIRFIELSEKSYLKKIQELYQIIVDFSPESIIVHTAPWDVISLTVMNALQGKCNRFLSNITDHAFWLGSTCFDYYFEFRDYGFNISRTYRYIDETKLLKLPYYPIINKDIIFKGFPFDRTGKQVIFSGGSIYKIQGSTKYFDVVKYILHKHENVVFYFLGGGDFEYLFKFVEDNNLKNRFYFDNERKDIYQIFKHSDVYFNTYPLIGGLMTQFACVAGILPITLNDTNDRCNDIFELMINNNKLDIQFDSVEKICSFFDKILENKDFLDRENAKLEGSIISKEKYADILRYYLNRKESLFTFKNYTIDIDKVSSFYINRFNQNKGKSYYQCFISKDVYVLSRFWKYVIKYLCR